MYTNLDGAYVVARSHMADTLAEAKRLRLARLAGKRRGLSSLLAWLHPVHVSANSPVNQASQSANGIRPTSMSPKA